MLVLTLQDHWLESTFCKLGVPSSMFSQCPILGLSKFPPDHQSFAKGTLSLQDHKNTQGVTQSLVIQSNLNYKKRTIFQSNVLLRDTKTIDSKREPECTCRYKKKNKNQAQKTCRYKKNKNQVQKRKRYQNYFKALVGTKK